MTGARSLTVRSRTWSGPGSPPASCRTATIAPNLITQTDPFPAGQSYPHDTTIAITVLKSLVGNGNLVNVCSYPSAGTVGTTIRSTAS